MPEPRDQRSLFATLAGAAFIVLGLWWLLRVLVPSELYDLLSRALGGVVLIVIGVIVLVVAGRGTFVGPRTGARLYRSRTDRWIGGVLGGLAVYLGIDALILRVAVILLALLGQGWPLVAYIVMWVLIPEEPLSVAGSIPGGSGSWPTTAPTPPTPPASPAPNSMSTPPTPPAAPAAGPSGPPPSSTPTPPTPPAGV